MGGLARSLALVLVAAYLAVATTPCPSTAPDAAAAERHAGPAVHGTHDHADGTTHHNAMAADSATAEAQWTARCLCGCGERPSVGVTPIGVGWAMVSRVPLPRPLASAAALDVGAPVLPDAPPRAVDHVPLPA